jgi:hypothetical protein
MITRVILDAWDIPVAWAPAHLFARKDVGGIKHNIYTVRGFNDPTDWYPVGK